MEWREMINFWCDFIFFIFILTFRDGVLLMSRKYMGRVSESITENGETLTCFRCRNSSLKVVKSRP